MTRDHDTYLTSIGELPAGTEAQAATSRWIGRSLRRPAALLTAAALVAAPLALDGSSADAQGVCAPSVVDIGAGRTVVGYGDTGGRVEQVQRQLRRLGHDIPVTGYYGDMTTAAVQQVQTAHGLPADGYVGPQTTPSLFRQAPPSEAAGMRNGVVISTLRNHAWLFDANGCVAIESPTIGNDALTPPGVRSSLAELQETTNITGQLVLRNFTTYDTAGAGSGIHAEPYDIHTGAILNEEQLGSEVIESSGCTRTGHRFAHEVQLHTNPGSPILFTAS